MLAFSEAKLSQFKILRHTRSPRTVPQPLQADHHIGNGVQQTEQHAEMEVPLQLMAFRAGLRCRLAKGRPLSAVLSLPAAALHVSCGQAGVGGHCCPLVQQDCSASRAKIDHQNAADASRKLN